MLCYWWRYDLVYWCMLIHRTLTTNNLTTLPEGIFSTIDADLMWVHEHDTWTVCMRIGLLLCHLYMLCLSANCVRHFKSVIMDVCKLIAQRIQPMSLSKLLLSKSFVRRKHMYDRLRICSQWRDRNSSVRIHRPKLQVFDLVCFLFFFFFPSRTMNMNISPTVQNSGKR